MVSGRWMTSQLISPSSIGRRFNDRSVKDRVFLLSEVTVQRQREKTEDASQQQIQLEETNAKQDLGQHVCTSFNVCRIGMCSTCSSQKGVPQTV